MSEQKPMDAKTIIAKKIDSAIQLLTNIKNQLPSEDATEAEKAAWVGGALITALDKEICYLEVRSQQAAKAKETEKKAS